jgi:hypothetical protein
MTTPALSPADFAAQVLKQPLWPHQVELAESTAFISTVAAARRVGKSTVAQVLAMWTAFTYRNSKTIILSAGQDSSRRMTEAIADELNAHKLTRGAVVDDFSTRIRLSNASEIVSLPASQKQVRGYGKGVKLLVLDECGFMAQELWAAAQYTALDEKANGSRILLLGTPWGPADHFFRRSYEAGLVGDDPDYRTFHWSHTVNPDLDHAYLERQRDRVSPQSYASEVLGQWSDAIGSLFTPELLESCTADVLVPALHELHGPATGVLGTDWGASYDLSSVGTLWRLPVAHLNRDLRPVPRFIAYSYAWSAGTPLHSVVTDIVAASGCYRYIASETNGIGAAPTQDLVRMIKQTGGRQKRIWATVHTTSASKTASYSQLLNLMEKGQLVLPRDPDLLRQFLGIRWEMKERGFTSIGAQDAADHDDRTDALSLCMLPHRPAGAHRFVCHTAELAGSRRATADARVPEIDCPVVSTGAGLRLAQRPTLQGVADQRFTTYAPEVPAKPEGFTEGRFRVTTTKQGV